MAKIKIVIADDQPIIRDGLKMLLELEEDLEIVGLAANGEEAYFLAEEFNPDVILMDIRMPKVDGVLGTRNICAKFPNIKIIILTTFSDDEYIFEALRAGARGYLLKDVHSDELVASIRMIMKGGVLIHPDVAAKLLNGFSNLTQGKKDAELEPKVDKAEVNKLTQREQELVELIGTGKTNREIADKLFLSEGTVKNHITNILSKLYLRDRTQIALYDSEKKR